MFPANRLRGLSAAAVLFCALPRVHVALAADSAGEVLVPGTRLQQGPFEPVASVSIITAERIAASPAQTVADLLDREAGVHVQSLFGNYAARTTVDLRGFGVTGGQNTLILLDGRRLNDVDLSSVDFATLPLSNIDHIEIVRSSGAVLYGDGASGGTINIVTRRPQAGESSGLLGISGGSYDTRKLEGHMDYGWKRAALNLAAGSIDTDGYRDNNKLSQRNAQLEWRVDGEAANFYAKAGLSHQRIGLPGVRTVDPGAGLNDLADDRMGTDTPLDYARERTGYFTFGVARRFGNGGFLADAGYRDRNQTSLFAVSQDYLDTKLRTVSLTPRMYIDHTLPGLSGRLVGGVDFYDYDYDSARALDPQTVNTPIHRLLIGQRSLAAYVNNTSHPTQRLNLDLGARLQRMRIDAQDRFNADAPGAVEKFEFTGAPDFARTDTESMFEAGMGYRLAEDAQLFVRAGRSVRFGIVDELYEYDETFSRVFSALKPQIARHVEVGARYAQGILDASLTLYGMELKDEIHFNPVTFANENLDPTRRRGAEAELGVQATANLAVRANLTLQRATFREGMFKDNDVPIAPRRLANVSLLWTVIPEIQVSTVWHYVASKRLDNDEANAFATVIPAYETLDAKVTADYHDWSFALSAHNLLDEKAYDYGVASTFTPGRFNAYPLPTRNFTLGVSRSFK